MAESSLFDRQPLQLLIKDCIAFNGGWKTEANMQTTNETENKKHPKVRPQSIMLPRYVNNQSKSSIN